MRTLCWVSLITSLMLLSAPAHAQEPEGQARCLLLGPLAVSGYVAFLEKVGAEKRFAAFDRAASATNLIDLYARLDCPMPALIDALECLSAALIDAETAKPVAEIAETCMREAGMPVR